MRKQYASLAVKQAGFTLIELVIVIVIIGILAAVAIPKFFNLAGDAHQAAVDGVAGNLASAVATNCASRQSTNPPAGTVALTDCASITTNITSLIDGGFPTGMSLNGTCNVTDGTATSAKAVAVPTQC